jgi:beta-glucosidase
MRLGADVRGYLYWSLLDNYEWGSYTPTFGLYSVNRENFERTAKPSMAFYREITENNGVTQDIIRKYLSENPRLN